MNVTFHGVRGSTPCSCEGNRRYGGNTACVSIEIPGADPIVLDLGTGLRFFGAHQPHDGSFHANALVSHLHWDHVQGLPFCTALQVPGASLDIYGPPQDGLSLAEAFDEFMRPPYFPVRVTDLIGTVNFHTIGEDDLAVGDAKLKVRSVPHIGLTYGYRIEVEGASIAYISDHQQPTEGGFRVSDEVLELADGADLVIHDAQYSDEEFALKPHWGHCTADYALRVAAEAGARRVALFHHDPSHDDDSVDRLVERSNELGARLDLTEVLAASEGLTVALGPVSAALR